MQNYNACYIVGQQAICHSRSLGIYHALNSICLNNPFLSKKRLCCRWR